MSLIKPNNLLYQVIFPIKCSILNLSSWGILLSIYQYQVIVTFNTSYKQSRIDRINSKYIRIIEIRILFCKPIYLSSFISYSKNSKRIFKGNNKLTCIIKCHHIVNLGIFFNPASNRTIIYTSDLSLISPCKNRITLIFIFN